MYAGLLDILRRTSRRRLPSAVFTILPDFGVILYVSSMSLPMATFTGIMPRLMTWKPLHIFAMALAGWMNRQQQDVIAYLEEENRILQEKLGHKRILMDKTQKTRLTACLNAKEEL